MPPLANPYSELTGSHLGPRTSIQREVGERLFKDGYIPDPVGCVNPNGRPVFDASVPTVHNVTEKDMKETGKLMWRTYALWKTSLKVERRDSVYEALVAGEYSNLQAAHHFLGTPFPMIEPHPHIAEAFVAIRWYEHFISALISVGFYQYMRTKPVLRYSHLNMTVQKGFIWFCFVFFEFLMGERAIMRLAGKIENEAECYKFGVLETRDRLERKVEYYRKFRDFKNEWLRRWDYHVWGMRPGERYKIWSACFFPAYPIMFCEKVDFPMRKNPFTLSSAPLSEYKLEPIAAHWYPTYNKAKGPVVEGHPEFKYLYRPLSTSGWNV